MRLRRPPSGFPARLAPRTRGGVGRAIGVTLALGLGGCAPIPPPDVLGELDTIRSAPAVAEARELVPSAVSRAELLRIEANQALEQGDFAGAQIVGERARAAYALAVAVARVARAQQVEAEAAADAQAKDEELGAADAEQQQVAAEVAALELELAAVGQPEGPDGSGGAASPADNVAAVRSVELQARLLCTAARLLHKGAAPMAGGPADGPSAPLPPLSELDARLGAAAAGTRPLAAALELREQCRRHVVALRRILAKGGDRSPRADELLVTLSSLGAGDVRRDDRGLGVTLRDVFSGFELAPAASSKLAALGEIARRHPSFPLLVVLHESTHPTGKAHAADPNGARRGEALVRALGVEAAVAFAGDAQPLLPARSRHASRNDRVEVVFVSPSLL